VVPILHFDQLGGDAQPVTSLADAAAEDGLDLELLADLAHVGARLTDLERRGARRHAQTLDLDQQVDDLLGDPLAEVVLVLLGAEVGEGEHGDGGDLRLPGGARLLLQRLELVAQVERRLVATRRVLLETPLEDAPEMVGQRHVELADRRWRVAQDRGDEISLRLALEGAAAGRHLVEDDAEGEDVGTVIGDAALHLLGRHVRDRPQHRARLGQRLGADLGLGLLALEPRELGEPEVEDLHPPVLGHHDVGRLQIAVDDAAQVRRRQCVGQRNRQRQELIDRQPAARDLAIEPLALDQLHGDEP
jgi:hypothetical protein